MLIGAVILQKLNGFMTVAVVAALKLMHILDICLAESVDALVIIPYYSDTVFG